MNDKLVYRPVQPYSREEAEEAIRTNDIDTLVYVAFSTGMLGSDWKYAQDLCVRLSEHEHPIVRGNALLGLEYIARFQGKLEQQIVKPVLLRALKDPQTEVVERAKDAIAAINSYMEWRIGVRTKSPTKQFVSKMDKPLDKLSKIVYI